MLNNNMKRRSFLIKSIIGSIGMAVADTLSVNASSVESGRMEKKGKALFRIGICTDLHQDLITDGPARVQSFITEMNKLRPDFIIQMGDFCVPKPANQPIMDIWNQFKGPKYHVIGNHDTDGGFTHDQVVEFWNAKGKYYSFDYNNYHFVILNGNERAPENKLKGYPNSILKEQHNWLKQDLDSTNLPVMVFCHQGIDNDLDGLKEGNQMRILFERANKKAGFQKVQLVLSGHHHEDYHNVYNNINYLQINSISYQFAHLKDGYDFASTIDPIWAFITVYDNGIIDVKGKRSSYKNEKETGEYDGYPTVPFISDREIKVEVRE